MAYTPINWQTGDTITAEKLNRCDNGWAVENDSTQILSETVTTDDDWDGCYAGLFAHQGLISADTIVVTYDDADYTLSAIADGSSNYSYGGFTTSSGPDFSTYPFGINSDADDGTYLITPTASTHSVIIKEVSESVATSDSFKSAVLSVGVLPLLCVSGVTTSSEIEQAVSNGRLLYFKYYDWYYICTSYDRGTFTYIKDDAATSVTANVTGGIFTVTTS